MITFSKTTVAGFKHTNQSLRYGQQFHQTHKLNKITDEADKRWCDKLYNATDEVAKAMLASRTDHSQ